MSKKDPEVFSIGKSNHCKEEGRNEQKKVGRYLTWAKVIIIARAAQREGAKGAICPGPRASRGPRRTARGGGKAQFAPGFKLQGTAKTGKHTTRFRIPLR